MNKRLKKHFHKLMSKRMLPEEEDNNIRVVFWGFLLTIIAAYFAVKYNLHL